MNHKFNRGDLVVKLNWHNKPMEMGIVTGENADLFERGRLQVLFPRGPAEEYPHDIFPLDDNKIQWNK